MKRVRTPIQVPGVVTASRDVPGGHRIDVELAMEHDRVPGILMIPDRPWAGENRSAAALLLHGLTSRKERMAEGIGRALLAWGVATLSIDLPMHGARGNGMDEVTRNPLQMIATWRRALSDVRGSFDYLSDVAAVDSQRVAIVGYSLGAYLAIVAAGDDARCRAIVLASGGDLPEQVPFESIVRAAADPLRAVRKLCGRPLLMVNGRFDRTIKAVQAERLFEAAGDPKEIHWYQGGHWPPQPAIDFGAQWLAERLSSGEWRLASG
ncbi:MAG TPA: alpha/beta fold hydrolase [Gemmatimonadaceae bacterium]